MELQQSKFCDLNLTFSIDQKKQNKFKVIEIDLLDKCQLKCPMCLRQENQKRIKANLKESDLQDLKDFFLTLKNLTNFEIELVRLVGTLSEPTLYKKLPELITFLNSINICVQISTNGNIKNDKYWEDLKIALSNHKHNEILFAIEGSNQIIYEKYRRNGSLKNILENMKILSNKNEDNFNLGLQFIKFNYNQDELQKIEKLLETNNIKIDFVEIFNCNEPSSIVFTENLDIPTPTSEIMNKFYKKRIIINKNIDNNDFSFSENDIICVSELNGELFIDTSRRIWPCTNLYETNIIENNINIYNIKDTYMKIYNFYNNRCSNKECYKACSKFGHKLENPFLRKRVIK